MIFISVPWFVAAAYWVGFTITWRCLTGHFAWSVHLSAKTNETVRPPAENWIVAAAPCAFLSLLWPSVLLFTIPWRWPRGTEREAEVKLAGIEHKQLAASSEKLEAIAEQSWDAQFERLKGEVVDE